MNCSDTINELAAALAKAQGQFTNPKRDREVEVRLKENKGAYKFAYSTLSCILDMARKPLADNGLSLIHALDTDSEGTICKTRLLHSSGQWIEAWIPVLVDINANAQGWGSAITYARRYGICALLSIAADEDDDANASCGNEANAKARPARQSAKSPPPQHGKPSPASDALSTANRLIQEAVEPAALVSLAMRIEANEKHALTPEAIVTLLDDCNEKLYAMAKSEVLHVKSEDAAARLDYWKACIYLNDLQRQGIIESLTAITGNTAKSDNATPAAAL